MTDKELLEQLRTEVVAETPDCWSSILARVQAPAQQPEEEKVVPMPERGRRRGAWKRWVAAAAVFFLAVLGGGLYATQVPSGVATLDANPSIELTVNKLGRVLSARACNPDAQFVLDDLELRNQSLQAAADAIAHNGMADLVGHGVADAAAARAVFPAVDHQIGVGAAFPLRVQTPEFIVLFDRAGKFQRSPPILSAVQTLRICL